MRRAQRVERVGEQIEPLDPVHAPEIQDHERVRRDAEPRAIAAGACCAESRSTPFGTTAIGTPSCRSRSASASCSDVACSSAAPRRLRRSSSLRHSLAPSPAPHRLRLQHAPRRHHVRHAAGARQVRPPTTPARSRRRGCGRHRRGRARRPAARGPARRRSAAETRRHVAHRHAIVARRRAGDAGSCAPRWPSSSPLRHRRRRAAAPGTTRARRRAGRRTESRRKVRRDVKHAHVQALRDDLKRGTAAAPCRRLVARVADQQEPVEEHDRHAEVHHEPERHAEHRCPRSLEQVQRQPEGHGDERDEQLPMPDIWRNSRVQEADDDPEQNTGTNISGMPKSM